MCLVSSARKHTAHMLLRAQHIGILRLFIYIYKCACTAAAAGLDINDGKLLVIFAYIVSTPGGHPYIIHLIIITSNNDEELADVADEFK